MNDKEKVLYFDCFSGICGDMVLAAFIDLGVPVAHLETELGKMRLPGWRLRASPGAKSGIHGTRVDVDLLPVPASRSRSALVPATKTHEHRAYRDIKAMIEGSDLPTGTKGRALAIFCKLAGAEAKIHGSSVEDVRFHEVGAVDSIVDIVGAAIGLEYLAPDRILCSRVELGGGFVKCQHGIIPVPAPAVTELLQGVPGKSGATQNEMTTPTGAAILAASVDEFTDDKRFTILRTAYGVGHRDSELPNLLRLFLGERPVRRGTARALPAAAPGIVLECNIDDMSPELHGYLFERLLEAGADDVWLAPVVMKKSRAAITLSVLCAPDAEAELAELIVRETSTFGFRRYEVDKTSLERSFSTARTSLGPVRIKTAFLNGVRLKAKPEYEDLLRIARETGLSLREVAERVLLEIGARREDPE
jgi:pyridinium-3,5-bisthiocarboxylic acid mononucleotide nickel chelatase